MRINTLRAGILLLVIIFSGCAGPSLYSIHMYYDAEKAAIPAHLQKSGKPSGAGIAVAEFSDNRQIDDRNVIGRVIHADGSKYLVFPKTVQATKSIPHGIKKYLNKAGYKVADKLEQWNLKEGDIPHGDSKLLIGGNIEELEINCRKGHLTHSYTGHITLNIYFADMAKGRILYVGQVASRYTKEGLLFSENIMGEQADIVLGDAIEKFFEDKVVVRKLKEALAE